MHKQEPFPRHILGLLSLGWRIVIGASLGFLCAIAIIGANSNGTALTRGEGLYHTIVAAWRTGGVLGAIYLPIALAWFLPKQHAVKTVVVALVAAIIFGIVGDAAVGPWAPASVSASLGFWLVTFAIYQHDHRSRTWHGRGSFLP